MNENETCVWIFACNKKCLLSKKNVLNRIYYFWVERNKIICIASFFIASLLNKRRIKTRTQNIRNQNEIDMKVLNRTPIYLQCLVGIWNWGMKSSMDIKTKWILNVYSFVKTRETSLLNFSAKILKKLCNYQMIITNGSFSKFHFFSFPFQKSHMISYLRLYSKQSLLVLCLSLQL